MIPAIPLLSADSTDLLNSAIKGQGSHQQHVQSCSTISIREPLMSIPAGL